MKCDFQQTELQERLAQMKEMRRLQLTIATTSSSTRAIISASSSASSSIMAIGEEDGNKEVSSCPNLATAAILWDVWLSLQKSALKELISPL